MKPYTHRPPGLRKQSGVAAVELALVTLPLILLLVSAVEFARAIYTYDQLTKSVREGARYISFFDPSVAAEYPTALAKQRMVYGEGASPLVPGLTEQMITICDRKDSTACPGETFADINTGAGTISLVKVSISGYTFTPLFTGFAQIASFRFEPISATMRQVYP